MTGYSLSYILDSLSLSQLMLIHNYGIDFEETKSIILLNKVVEIITGKKSKKSIEEIPENPDIAKFKQVYGKRIKTFKDKKK
jgi:hypothetical protein